MSSEIIVDGTIYSDAVVTKTAYWYAAAYVVDIRRHQHEPTSVVITISGREHPLTPAETATIQARFRRDLIDHKTRQIVADETRTIRELLVAKAFADAESEHDS